MPEAKKQFDEIINQLKVTWPKISHHPGGSDIQLERMLNGEHVVVTFSCEGNLDNALYFPEGEQEEQEDVQNEDGLSAEEKIDKMMEDKRTHKDVLESQGVEGEDKDMEDFKDMENWDESEKFSFDVSITKGMPSRDGSPRRMLMTCSMYRGEWVSVLMHLFILLKELHYNFY